MKIRRLKSDGDDGNGEEPLTVVRESLSQMEQILDDHFLENENQQDQLFSFSRKWRSRILGWIKSLINFYSK